MLIPQFSIRSLLILTAGCAVVFSCVGLALQGHAWAGGIAIGVFSLVVAFAIYALFFTVIWGAAGATAPPTRPPGAATVADHGASEPHAEPSAAAGSGEQPGGGNPFATK